MVTTPYLGLPNISASQNNKSITHNEALQILDVIVQRGVIDKDLATPPGSPTNGDAYIVAAGGTGAWAGKDDTIAYYWGGWQLFITPKEGFTVWANDEDKHYTFDGSAWAVSGLNLEDLTDTVFTGLAQGDILRRNGSSQWVNEKPTYDIGIGRTSGAPGSSEVLLDFVCNRTIVLPASMTDSVAEAGVAATAQTDLDVQKNGASVATIRFAAAGTVASFINAGADTFAAGDNLRVVAPASPDATLADIVFTLAFTRS